jgi:hypothetical protein
LKLLFNDGNQHVSADGRPDLSLHGVLACAEKVLDAQVLLDPFEKEFDLPTVFVQGCDGGGRQTGVVGQEDQRFFGAGVRKPNTSNVFGIVLDGIKALERNTLIGDHPRASICWSRVDASGPKVVFCSGDKKGARLMKAIKPLEIHVASVHHVEGSGLEDEHVEHLGVVGLAVGEVDKGWDCAPKVQKGVDLDRRLGRTKQGPRKKAHAQVDGAGVQGIDRVLQIQPQVLLAVDPARPSDQDCGKICPDSPIPSLVGIGQGAFLDQGSKPHAIEFARVRPQARLDVSKRLSQSQLRKSHDSKVLGRRQRPHTRISLVTLHDSGETRPGDGLHDLCKQRLADVHGQPPESLSIPGSYPFLALCSSNRHQTKLASNPHPATIFGSAGAS